MDLKEIAKEIREIITLKQKELSLTFIEDTHTYYMKDMKGNIVDNYPSVSKVLKCFYTEFPSHEKSLQKAKGCEIKQKEILLEWQGTADYATNMGSRVHYILEQTLVEMYGKYKEVRQPIFDCDESQITKGDNMISAGKEFIDIMHERGAVLLDTEMVLGDIELGYTGQPDKMWLMLNKNNELGICVSDYKSNKPKNFESHWYTVPMLEPFTEYPDTALSHYFIQLPLYVRLLLSMLKGSKYDDIKFFGGIVVLLKEDGNFVEYRIPKDIYTKIFEIDIKQKINELCYYTK